MDLKVDNLVASSFSSMEKTDQPSKIKIAQLLAEVLDSEEDLQELYEEFLEKHKGLLFN